MKRKLITPVLILLLAGGGFLATQALADRDHQHGRYEKHDRCDMDHGRAERYERIAAVLDLSDQQREQIRSIINGSRQGAEPLREQLRDNRRALREASEAERFDEAKIRALASASGNLQAELTIHRAQTRQQLRAQLTPEQQALFDKIKPLLQERRHDGPMGSRFGRFDDDDRDHHGPRFRDADPS